MTVDYKYDQGFSFPSSPSPIFFIDAKIPDSAPFRVSLFEKDSGMVSCEKEPFRLLILWHELSAFEVIENVRFFENILRSRHKSRCLCVFLNSEEWIFRTRRVLRQTPPIHSLRENQPLRLRIRAYRENGANRGMSETEWTSARFLQ